MVYFVGALLSTYMVCMILRGIKPFRPDTCTIHPFATWKIHDQSITAVRTYVVVGLVGVFLYPSNFWLEMGEGGWSVIIFYIVGSQIIFFCSLFI